MSKFVGELFSLVGRIALVFGGPPGIRWTAASKIVLLP